MQEHQQQLLQQHNALPVEGFRIQNAVYKLLVSFILFMSINLVDNSNVKKYSVTASFFIIYTILRKAALSSPY